MHLIEVDARARTLHIKVALDTCIGVLATRLDVENDLVRSNRIIVVYCLLGARPGAAINDIVNRPRVADTFHALEDDPVNARREVFDNIPVITFLIPQVPGRTVLGAKDELIGAGTTAEIILSAAGINSVIAIFTVKAVITRATDNKVIASITEQRTAFITAG